MTSAFQGDLDEQPDAEPGYIFENLAEFTAGAEDLVDLGAEPLAGRYSSCTS